MILPVITAKADSSTVGAIPSVTEYVGIVLHCRDTFFDDAAPQDCHVRWDVEFDGNIVFTRRGFSFAYLPLSEIAGGLGAGTYTFHLTIFSPTGEERHISRACSVTSWSGTVYWVTTDGDDGNDGLTRENGKLNVSSARTAGSTNPWVVLVEPDVTCTWGASSWSNNQHVIKIAEAGADPIMQSSSGFISGTFNAARSDMSYAGLRFENTGSATTFWSVGGGTSSMHNIHLWDCGLDGELADWSGAFIYGNSHGCSVYDFDASVGVVSNAFFVQGDTDDICFYGSDGHVWNSASTNERAYRSSSGVGITFDGGIWELVHASNGKQAMRWEASTWLYIYNIECNTTGTAPSDGTCWIGCNADGSVGTSTIRAERTNFYAVPATLNARCVKMNQGVADITFASCVFRGPEAGIIGTEFAGSPAVFDWANVKVLGCTFVMNSDGTTSQSPFQVSGSNANELSGLVFEGNVLIQEGTWASGQRWIIIPADNGGAGAITRIANNLFSTRAGVDVATIGGTGYDFTELNAEAWASGNEEDTFTVNATTYEPSVKKSIPAVAGVHKSINGSDIPYNVLA